MQIGIDMAYKMLDYVEDVDAVLATSLESRSAAYKVQLIDSDGEEVNDLKRDLFDYLLRMGVREAHVQFLVEYFWALPVRQRLRSYHRHPFCKILTNPAFISLPSVAESNLGDAGEH